MRKIFLFMMVSLDGYFEGTGHDLSWHQVDEEFEQYANKQLDEVDTLIMGRVTYQLMEEYWPSEDGRLDNAETAKRMNTLSKIVYSKTLTDVKETEHWKNVTLKHEVDADEISSLKEKDGKDIAVLGSSNLCVSLLKEGLLDELRIMVNPIVIGAGTPLFQGIDAPVKIKLVKTRGFKNGNVLLTYQVEKN